MMMVAFSVELELGRDITAIVTVVPLSGFNLFLLAILVNLLLGHIAINCHRMAANEGSSRSPVSTNSRPQHREALKDHVFRWRHQVTDSGSNSYSNEHDKAEIQASTTTTPAAAAAPVTLLKHDRYQFTLFGKSFITTIIIASIFLVVAGVFLLTFVFHFKGLVGLLLGNAADNSYSVVSTGTTVPRASGDPHSFIVRWIQVCFFGFGVVMPLLFLLIMLIVWLIPMSVTGYQQLMVAAEVANAWNAIDVFVISVVAALFEIEQFADFIIGDVCDGINEVLKVCCDEQLDGDDKCFDVTASLLPMFWVLGLASCVMFFFGLGLLKISQRSLHERRNDHDDNNDHDNDDHRQHRTTHKSDHGEHYIWRSLHSSVDEQSNRQEEEDEQVSAMNATQRLPNSVTSPVTTKIASLESYECDYSYGDLMCGCAVNCCCFLGIIEQVEL
jgi:hypothetical protein